MLSPLSTNQPIKKFCFKCQFRYHQKNIKLNVAKWLEAAIKRHVEEIHLTLPSHTFKPDHFVSQTLVVLKLESVYVAKDTSCVHLPSLKTLSLTSVSFENQNDYINFLYACPILEDWHAEPIYFMERDEKNASKEGLKFLTLPKLVRASIRIIDGLFNFINNVKFLNLISIKLMFPSYPYICWDGVVQLLRHCPKLQTLCIKKVFFFAWSFFFFLYILIFVV